MTEPSEISLIGAGGYVGSSILARFAVNGSPLTGLYHSASAESRKLQFDFWSDEHPHLDKAKGVLFAATIERDDRPFEEFTQHVQALTSACSKTRFVYISTDAVFGGDEGLYAEEARTNPPTEYGRRSAWFERNIRQNCSNYCIIRPSYVYGYSEGILDKRLTRTFRALRSGESIAYYEDMFKSPIEVNQLAEIIYRVYQSEFCGTLHVGGPRMSVFDFHRRAATTFSAQTSQIKRDKMPTDSKHPVDSSLDSRRLEREFRLQPGGITESLTCSSINGVIEQ